MDMLPGKPERNDRLSSTPTPFLSTTYSAPPALPLAPQFVLIVSTDRGVVRSWVAAFADAGYRVALESSAARGVQLVGESAMPLVVIDVLDRQAVQAIRTLREAGDPVAVLAVTAAEDADRVVAEIDAGADACADRRCTGQELVARARAIGRRLRPDARADPEVWRVHDLRIDPAARSVVRQGREVPLSPKQFDTLMALVRSRGRILTTAEIIESVWRQPPLPDERSVRALICDLRRRLGDDHRDPRYIITARCGGYYVASA